TNTLALTGLQAGSAADSVLTVDGTGVIRRINKATLIDNIKANNGLNRDADSIQLGGPLTEPTTIGTSATNTLALTGLQAGNAADSILTVNATGVIRRINKANLLDNIKANNGLNRDAD